MSATVSALALMRLLAMAGSVAHDRLILLKSTSIPAGVDWAEAGRRGLVDEVFAEVLRDTPANLHVRAVNLRTWSA